MPGNLLKIGRVVGGGRELTLPPSARERHLYVCGGTGVGKSKFLEHCIRQDIFQSKTTGCGLLLIDPHGLVYENTMAWIVKHNLQRKVIPIELGRSDWVISYNMLRRRRGADPAAVVSGFVTALAHVWGQGGTDLTPLFARWASVLLLTLYQNGYTISDVMYLLSRQDVRRAMVAKMTDPAALHAWAKAEARPKEFETEIMSTINRFHRLSGPQVMKATFGQPDVSLDLRAALDEGHIILVNLSTEGGQIEEEDADTFATLLLSDLWATAKSRGKREREKTRPFYVYIDECQNFITPTIAKNLDQARGFGIHMTLANQFPSQFLNAGPSGKAMYDSIMANADNKIVFRTRHPDDMKTLAQWMFMSTLDTDQVKLKLLSTKVLSYREETRESRTTGKSRSSGKGKGKGGGSFQGSSDGSGTSGTGESAEIQTWNNLITCSSGESESWQESEFEGKSESESVTESTVFIPVMGQETSSVQYRSIDEQLFKAMQTLFDQEDRHFAIRFHGGPKAPLFVTTPSVEPATVQKKLVNQYRKKVLKKLKFAIPMVDAMKRLEARERKLLTEFVDIPSEQEPKSARGKPVRFKRARGET